MRHAAEAMRQAEEQGDGYRLYAELGDDDPLQSLGGNGSAPSLGAGPSHGTPGVLHFQPVYGIASRRVEGFEAFLRWQHPELGLVFPRHFLSKADFTGLILAIGPWIVQTACAQIRAWQRKGNRSLRLAVNLSPWELQHPDLVNRIGHALRETGLAPRFLQLEVPEEWAFDQVDRAIETIRGLRSLGATVCLDGFGDGASSLMLLRRVPVDAIKMNLFGERAGAEIATRVASAIALAKSLQLRVIAQGVESAELLEQLRSWQCDEVQGYHWGPPMSPHRCEELLTQFTGRLRPWARAQTRAPA
jgi:EAL domain-containing protein (putative c-di-GMP-specific phosphodiesterase class I)